MRRRTETLGAAARATLALVLLVSAMPAGEERHPQLGLALEPPPRFRTIPIQPDEQWVVLRYVGEREAKSGLRLDPKLYVVRIERGADPSPLPDPPPVNTFQRYLEREWPMWLAYSDAPGKARGGAATEYQLAPVSAASAAGLVAAGWAHAQDVGGSTWVVMGFCDEKDLDKQTRAWRRCAERLELFDPVPHPDSAKWARHYEKNPQFRSPELRVRLRERLVGKWEAQDTENYLLLFDTKKESLINHLAKRLEGIRREYVARFPPAGEITAVSAVRICKDQEQYHQYGGPPGTAGYWNPSTEELVLFVFESDGGDWQSGKENSRLVMYHEAFHQYIHYAVGELAPHSWFNEGYGDYFGGAQFNVNGKVGRIEANPWRVERIQAAVKARQHASWSLITGMEQKDFYSGQRSVNYAMAWSMIYFLEESSKVRKNPLWKRILPTYFETLKAANERQRPAVESAEQSGKDEERAKLLAGIRAEATKAAFSDVDMYEIEEAWREFVLDLKAPK